MNNKMTMDKAELYKDIATKMDAYKKIEGNVFDLQRNSIHDGPGIRTTVFLKGCPLRCLWCHNPESQKMYSELSYNPDMCIGCGECVPLCPNNLHVIENGRHSFDSKNCAGCFKCTENCFTGALHRVGENKSVAEVFSPIAKDKSYYESSGGGLTISGGEPLAQPDFVSALLKVAKHEGIHTCVETCGYAKMETLQIIAQDTDIFLYDYKETNSTKHKEFTGVSNELIIENLLKLDSLGNHTILRCPIIPGYNDTDEHFMGICNLASKLNNILEINIMPYHPYGAIKGQRVGMVQAMKDVKTPDEETITMWIEKINSNTDTPVFRG